MNCVTLIALTFISVAFHYFKVGPALGIMSDKIVDPAYTTFLFVLIYAAVKAGNIIHAFALAFLFAYISRWLIVLLSALEQFYEKIERKYSKP